MNIRMKPSCGNCPFRPASVRSIPGPAELELRMDSLISLLVRDPQASHAAILSRTKYHVMPEVERVLGILDRAVLTAYTLMRVIEEIDPTLDPVWDERLNGREVTEWEEYT